MKIPFTKRKEEVVVRPYQNFIEKVNTQKDKISENDQARLSPLITLQSQIHWISGVNTFLKGNGYGPKGEKLIQSFYDEMLSQPDAQFGAAMGQALLDSREDNKIDSGTGINEKIVRNTAKKIRDQAVDEVYVSDLLAMIGIEDSVQVYRRYGMPMKEAEKDIYEKVSNRYTSHVEHSLISRAAERAEIRENSDLVKSL